MKTVSLRTSVPVSLVLVLLAGASAAAQTTTGIAAAPSLGSQIAPLAGVRTTGTRAPAGAAMPNDDPGSVASGIAVVVVSEAEGRIAEERRLSASQV